MRNCLSDNEISSFVGGDLKNDTEIINHLNSCPNCFEQVTTVMSLIDENKDIYDRLNRSYEKMIYEMTKYICENSNLYPHYKFNYND